MKDADVSRQIQQMIRFIRQEAEEKANEISVAAEEEFNIEKLQLLEAEKRKIRQEYERKAKQIDVRRKIEYSTQLNAARIKVLQAQDDAVGAMKDAAKKGLLRISNDKKVYRKLVKDMIVQGLLRLREPSVLLRCRESDRKLVESLIEEAKKEYSEKANMQAPKIALDDRVYLPPSPKNSAVDSHEPYCTGGIVLASEDGKIVLENTLDARLDVIFRQKLPEACKEAPVRLNNILQFEFSLYVSKWKSKDVATSFPLSLIKANAPPLLFFLFSKTKF
ncbi:hypothetical protein JHK82_032756 [Glycine max]|nr:hypothetical protein JHK87_032691 [Glycine soja]KAG4979501.1 hypothetical protein JHK85_033459 [Glycine max]KAG4985152.1 hypothetical protein JHK86_032843 [Glycine max]KAG5118334.1 hypothetical protein JHK82_032754 [Glycine max]KAG5118336.1 hypothetical protein JHK82_032756 [Glycine max]